MNLDWTHFTLSTYLTVAIRAVTWAMLGFELLDRFIHAARRT
jgi:hypothetical protein